MGRTGHQHPSRIGDRYRLVERLGSGGMSVVWRAFDEILGRQVAVKVLSPHLAGDDAFRERLRQEALAAARLCHPHITGIYDFGETADGTYVVMELIDGESAAGRLRRQGAMPWADAVTLAAEVAAALATAHARGVVHRDVTPANVMLTAAGAKVVDFGISALVGQRDAAPDGSLLGTPAYLAPERLAGGPVTTATDVYALGLLLYRCLTARLPWPAETTAEALRAHLYADPEPLPPLPGLPAEVPALCLRCLAKDPADRPAAAEVATVLAAVVGGRAVVPEPGVRSLAGVPALGLGASARAGHAPAPSHARHAPVPRRRSALRLRAGLRLAASLRLGAPDPLGDGLFGGGRLGRDVLGLVSGLLPGAAAIGRGAPALTGWIAGRRSSSTLTRWTAGRRSSPALTGWIAGRRSSSALTGWVAGRRHSPGLTGFLVPRRRSSAPGAAPGGGRGPLALAGVFSGRQRLQAAVVTGAMLAVVGLSWFGDREPPDVATAQAAGVTGGVAPAIRHGVACKVRYQVRRDSGGSFTARLTVVNTGSRPIAGWRLEFAYPGGQRLARAGKSVTQRGRTVLIRSHAPRPLAPGRSSVTTLRGDYRDMNPLPLAFALNGHPCLAEVLGATSADTPDVSADTDPRQVTEAAGAERPAGAGAGAGAGDGGGPGRRDDQTRSRQKAKPDKSRPQPHPDVTTAPPPAKGIGHTTSV